MNYGNQYKNTGNKKFLIFQVIRYKLTIVPTLQESVLNKQPFPW